MSLHYKKNNDAIFHKKSLRSNDQTFLKREKNRQKLLTPALAGHQASASQIKKKLIKK